MWCGVFRSGCGVECCGVYIRYIDIDRYKILHLTYNIILVNMLEGISWTFTTVVGNIL